MDVMVELSHISKKYGKKQILNDINIQIHYGESIAIVGKNGCGKSTLLQIMAGIIKPDKGDIYYLKKDVLRDKSFFKKYCGYVPQENPLIEELSVKDNLRLWGWKKKYSHGNIEEQFQLDDIMDHFVSNLSGGMKRRLSIACSMIHNPLIMLMDEPTTALDIYFKENVQEWINQYRSKNGIVIMTTHDEKEIMNADRCFIMVNGKLEEITEVSTMRMKKIREYITNV